MAPIKFVRLPHADGIGLPTYAHPGDAGADLTAAVTETVYIEPGARALIPTGFSMDIPDGYEVQVRSRSGLALRYGVVVLNSPGTVDASYKGEVGVILANFGEDRFDVRRGDRIAQMVVASVAYVPFVEADELSESSRGIGGFGSTGRA